MWSVNHRNILNVISVLWNSWFVDGLLTIGNLVDGQPVETYLHLTGLRL